jgi:hypothetical protein
LATVATTGAYSDLSGTPALGTAASTASSAYATAAQGTLADSATQPGDLATVATTGAYSDLSGKPTLGTAAATASTAYATAAQGALADSATQPGDNISTLTNNAGYTTNVGDITGVTAGSGISGGGTSGTVTISHADTSSQASVNGSGRTYIQDITLDTYGHVTGIATATETVVNTDTNTTYSAGSGLSLSGTTFSVQNDLRGEAWVIGRDNNDFISVNAANMDFVLDNNVDMKLYNNGNLHVEGNVIAYSTTISDERLKTDIVKIDSALDKVDQINGYTFTYTADGKKSAGVIAQEVEKVLPSAITESALPLKMGEDDKTEYKTVQYDQLIGLLVEAVKELKAEVSALKGQ